MENLNLKELENINGGHWTDVARAGLIAGGGIEMGVGMAGALAGVLTCDHLLAGAGGSAMIDGFNHISSAM